MNAIGLIDGDLTKVRGCKVAIFERVLPAAALKNPNSSGPTRQVKSELVQII